MLEEVAKTLFALLELTERIYTLADVGYRSEAAAPVIGRKPERELCIELNAIKTSQPRLNCHARVICEDRQDSRSTVYPAAWRPEVIKRAEKVRLLISAKQDQGLIVHVDDPCCLKDRGNTVRIVLEIFGKVADWSSRSLIVVRSSSQKETVMAWKRSW